ncbi:MAG: hypothetical protein AAGG00_03190 [Cyanobacteria bacterium P01_H01_bin.150]
MLVFDRLRFDVYNMGFKYGAIIEQETKESLTKHMGLIPRQPTVEELGWGNSPFPIPAFSLQPFAFSLFLMSL